MSNPTTPVREDFVNRLIAATGWAAYFESQGKFSEARTERQLATHLADCLARSDFRTSVPMEFN